MYDPQFTPWTPKPMITLSPGKPRRAFQYLITAFGRDIVRGMMDVYRLDLENEERAVEQYRSAAQGKSRFLVAFRHPGDNDPQIAYLVLNSRLNRALRKAGIPAHQGAIFLASTEIPLWGGPVVTFALKHAGTIPVSHGALSKSTMDTIMSTIMDSPVPVAIAPEGQVTYYSHVMPDFDQGTAQIGLWAQGRLDDRAKRAGTEPVAVNILPMGVFYRFPKETWARLDRCTRDCENMLGYTGEIPAALAKAAKKKGHADADSTEARELCAHFRARFAELWSRIADAAVGFYATAYGYDEAKALEEAGSACTREADGARKAETPGTPVAGSVHEGAGTPSAPGAGTVHAAGTTAAQICPGTPAFTELRFKLLCGFAMNRAERYYGVAAKGTLRDRVMFLRAHSMNLAFPAAPEGRERTWIERKLAERGAGDAYWLHRHQELVDLSWYLTAHTVTENDSFDQLAETAQNLTDLAQRLVGGSFGNRRRFFKKAVTVRFGAPIPVSESLALGRREAMGAISKRIREGFEALLPG